MQVKGFETHTIEAKRFSKSGERISNVRIDQNSTVTQISKVGEDTASVEFRFTANYVGMGYIKIEGQITLCGEVSILVDEWSKKNSMPVRILRRGRGTSHRGGGASPTTPGYLLPAPEDAKW